MVYGYEAAVFDLSSQSRIATLQIQESALSDCLFTDEDHVAYAGQGGVALYDLAAGRDVWTGRWPLPWRCPGTGAPWRRWTGMRAMRSSTMRRTAP